MGKISRFLDEFGSLSAWKGRYLENRLQASYPLILSFGLSWSNDSSMSPETRIPDTLR